MNKEVKQAQLGNFSHQVRGDKGFYVQLMTNQGDFQGVFSVFALNLKSQKEKIQYRGEFVLFWSQVLLSVF